MSATQLKCAFLAALGSAILAGGGIATTSSTAEVSPETRTEVGVASGGQGWIGSTTPPPAP